MVIEENTSFRKIWAIKRDLNDNTIDVLMTPHSGLDQCFIPNDTIVTTYNFKDVSEFNLFYDLVRRLMDYRVYVDFASKDKGNKQLRKLVQPKINSFIKSLNMDLDTFVTKNPDLPGRCIDFDVQKSKPEIDNNTPIFAYKLQSDENGKWIYTLALKKYEPATVKSYPEALEPKIATGSQGNYFALARVYISGFLHDDKQYCEYLSLIREQFKKYCPSNYILDENRDRINRFNNYFSKRKSR